MRLSRISWIIIISCIVITAFASLGTLSWQQFQKRNQLREELVQTEEQLNGFQAGQYAQRQETLEMQLNQTLSELQTSKSMFSQPIWSITTGTLFDIAKASNTEVTAISSSGPTSAKLGGISCSAQTFAIRIEGDVPDLVSFITRLNQNLKAAVVKSVIISVLETTGEEKSTADLQLVVYTYEGD